MQLEGRVHLPSYSAAVSTLENPFDGVRFEDGMPQYHSKMVYQCELNEYRNALSNHRKNHRAGKR